MDAAWRGPAQPGPLRTPPELVTQLVHQASTSLVITPAAAAVVGHAQAAGMGLELVQDGLPGTVQVAARLARLAAEQAGSHEPEEAEPVALAVDVRADSIQRLMGRSRTPWGEDYLGPSCGGPLETH